MLGCLSVGILLRDPQDLQIVCGNCGHASTPLSIDLPAVLTAEEAAKCHVCRECGFTSAASRLEEKNTEDAVRAAVAFRARL